MGMLRLDSRVIRWQNNCLGRGCLQRWSSGLKGGRTCSWRDVYWTLITTAAPQLLWSNWFLSYFPRFAFWHKSVKPSWVSVCFSVSPKFIDCFSRRWDAASWAKLSSPQLDTMFPFPVSWRNWNKKVVKICWNEEFPCCFILCRYIDLLSESRGHQILFALSKFM